MGAEQKQCKKILESHCCHNSLKKICNVARNSETVVQIFGRMIEALTTWRLIIKYCFETEMKQKNT